MTFGTSGAAARLIDMPSRPADSTGMRAALTAAMWLLVANDAVAKSEPPPGDGALDARGWGQESKEIWRRPPADGAYHVAYTRRGCRVEEIWDGAQYTAFVKCAPGVWPN